MDQTDLSSSESYVSSCLYILAIAKRVKGCRGIFRTGINHPSFRSIGRIVSERRFVRIARMETRSGGKNGRLPGRVGDPAKLAKERNAGPGVLSTVGRTEGRRRSRAIIFRVPQFFAPPRVPFGAHRRLVLRHRLSRFRRGY